MSALFHDLKFGLRMLAKNPGFTAVAVLTLALGIGANTAVFTVLNSVVLHPLALPHPERAVQLFESVEHTDWSGSISYPNLKDWAQQNTVFEGISAVLDADFNILAKDGPSHIAGVLVSPNFFRVMGVEPKLGRTFAPDEEALGRGHVAILSEALWRSAFGADPAIIGRTVSINDETYAIVGVMPASFRFPGAGTQIWAPLVPDPSWESDRDDRMIESFARLKPGVTFDQALGEMKTIAHRLAQEYPQANKDRTVLMIPLTDRQIGYVRHPLWILQGAVVFVFLIALANVSNLLLGRAVRRQKEFAVRAALGAGRWRLMRQLLGESLLLTFAGAGFGWVVAVMGVRLLVAVDPNSLPRMAEIRPDGRVAAVTAVLAGLGAVALAALTAFKASRWNVQLALKEGRTATLGKAGRSINQLLVISQIGAALMLVIGAGLLAKTLWALLQVDPGFDVQHVLTMRVARSEVKYSGQRPAWTFYDPVLEKVGGIPGVRAAGLITFLPIQRAWCNDNVLVEGQTVATRGKGPWAEYRAVSADYYRAIGIPLERGRYFTASDNEQTSLVIIVNQTFVKDYLPGQNPIGKRVRLGAAPWATIVGVSRDVRQAGLGIPALPELDFPYRQATLVTEWPANFFTQSMSLVLRLSGNPRGVVGAVRDAVRSVDPTQPVFGVATTEQIVSSSTSSKRFYASVLGVFAGLALLLAALGTYGVVAEHVGEQRHDIGIRMALGARRSDVLGMVLKEGVTLILAGVAAGIAAALALTRFLASLLWNVKPTDPSIFIMAPFVLVLVALVACYVPARRATKVDPVVALRYE